VLEKYKAEWDVVRKGEELIRRAEYNALVSHIFSQVEQVYGPAVRYIEERSGKDQYSDIKNLVPDYDKVRDPCIAWAAKQPTILKNTYERVIKEGSAEEVKELIDIFRQASGVAAPAAPAAAAAGAAPAGGMAAAPAAAANDPKLDQAKAALKPVDTARSGQVQTADPNDFASAFKEFATG
jgi:hypothetical protein